MNELAASRTAMVTALMRGLHTRSDPDPLIDDTVGERLVPESVRTAIRESALARAATHERSEAPDAALDDALRANPAYANVITRSRYTEDALRAAVACGVRQYILIGAGFDSFAMRRPAFARDVEVIEIDLPATQELKRRRIEECGLPLPLSVHYVAADLSKESLTTALARSPFRPDEPAFFSWLGVTMYLTREANLASLRAIASCAAAGSELVFTYLDECVFRSSPDSSPFAELQRTVASVGEPFLSGFDPAQLADTLRSAGLALIEDLDGERIAQRYGGVGVAGLRSSPLSHIARARVAGQRGDVET